jgi:hypothetical protein
MRLGSAVYVPCAGTPSLHLLIPHILFLNAPLTLCWILCARVQYLSVRYVFSRLGDWMLPPLSAKPHWTRESRDDRIERFATVCFKCV